LAILLRRKNNLYIGPISYEVNLNVSLSDKGLLKGGGMVDPHKEEGLINLRSEGFEGFRKDDTTEVGGSARGKRGGRCLQGERISLRGGKRDLNAKGESCWIEGEGSPRKKKTTFDKLAISAGRENLKTITLCKDNKERKRILTRFLTKEKVVTLKRGVRIRRLH